MEACDRMRLVLAVAPRFPSEGRTCTDGGETGALSVHRRPGRVFRERSDAVHVREKAEELLPLVVETLTSRA